MDCIIREHGVNHRLTNWKWLQHLSCFGCPTHVHAHYSSGKDSLPGTIVVKSLILEAVVDHIQTVFFGANDACLPGSSTGQHVPLNKYKQNLGDILTHGTVTMHGPRIILITPPPVNEYLLEKPTAEDPVRERMRTAEHTKKYADACREVGKELGVVVLDLWSIFMTEAGWKDGEPLVGSKTVEPNEILEELLHDGIRSIRKATTVLTADWHRTSFQPQGLPAALRTHVTSYSTRMA